ncbi:hypothetical protein [Parabacteroides sp. FAFU027]|uniref:hypothetical protein n=1 Tax=Parabacteroides sp. FAFU027 TaxID=2922715 RepID=UPI001FAFC88D|nr:hypothetical protein [Parabacteroides sp. FAFU027]
MIGEVVAGIILGPSILGMRFPGYTEFLLRNRSYRGAFFAGVIMPSKFSFRKILIEKVEYVALGLMLPLFFY